MAKYGFFQCWNIVMCIYTKHSDLRWFIGNVCTYKTRTGIWSVNWKTVLKTHLHVIETLLYNHMHMGLQCLHTSNMQSKHANLSYTFITPNIQSITKLEYNKIITWEANGNFPFLVMNALKGLYQINLQNLMHSALDTPTNESTTKASL